MSKTPQPQGELFKPQAPSIDFGNLSARARQFRQVIANFVIAGLNAGKVPSVTVLAQYDYDTWLADTAQKASHLQAATHVLKATHSDAKGSSLYVPPVNLPKRTELGSHALGTDFVEDVASNAKYLGAYKFLKLEVEGKRLLDWLRHDDADLLAALSDNPDTARAYADAFCSLWHRSLPRQVDSCKGEFARSHCWRKTLGGRLPSDSCGRSSL